MDDAAQHSRFADRMNRCNDDTLYQVEYSDFSRIASATYKSRTMRDYWRRARELDPARPGGKGSAVTIGSAPAWRGVLTSLVLCAVLLALGGGVVAASNDNRLQAFAGAAPPPLVLDRLAGDRGGTREKLGRVVLVHFFATWCEPCRPELASLDRLSAESAPRGLDILAISVAEVEARLSRFFSENPVGFPILMDRDRSATRAWAIDALPSTVVLDRAGTPRLFVRGDLDWQRQDVRAALDALLAEPSGTGQQPDQSNGREGRP